MGAFNLLRPRQLGLVNTWREAEPRVRAAYGFFALLGLLFWVGLLAGSWYGLDLFFKVEVFGPLLLRKLLEILLLGLFGLLFFSNVVTALSTFYLSEDLEFLLAMPISRAVLHYNRLMETTIQSSWMMAMFGLPVFLAYGFVFRADALYYALLFVVIPCFTLIPVSLGIVVASLLVNVFPARRTREFMALLGIVLLVGLFLLLRLLQPERLVNAQAFESLAAYVAELQNPAPAFFPPRWASEVLLAAVQGQAIPWMTLALLVSGVLAITAIGRWLTNRLFLSGWARSQEARSARGAQSLWMRALLGLASAVVPRRMISLVHKDIRIFFRDPAQWSQVILLVALVIIYLFSVQVFPLDTLRGPGIRFWRSSFAFMNLGMTGFVMAGVAVRFHFTAVSAEGRAFWIVRSGPVAPSTFLWAKAVPGLLPMLVVGECLAVISAILLKADLLFTLASGLTALLLALGISGIALGLGALYPDFKADNAARAAAGPAGVLFMLAALGLVALVLVMESLPVFLWMRASYEGRSMSGLELTGTVLTLVLVAALCLCAAFLPVKYAAPRLWQKGL